MLYIHDIGTCRVLMLVIVGRKKHTLFHFIFVFSYLCILEMWFSADYVCVLQKINGISTCPKCIIVSISAWYLIIQLSSVLIIYTRCLDPPSPPNCGGIPDCFADRPKKWTNQPWLWPLDTTILLILKRLSLAILSILTSVDLGKWDAVATG